MDGSLIVKAEIFQGNSAEDDRDQDDHQDRDKGQDPFKPAFPLLTSPAAVPQVRQILVIGLPLLFHGCRISITA